MLKQHSSFRSFSTYVAAIAVMGLTLIVSGCSFLGTTSTAVAVHTATPVPTFTSGGIYVNPALHFSLTVPTGWLVQQQYGVHQLPHTATVTLVGINHPQDQISVNVTEGDAAVRAFAAKGTAPTRVGIYPAFIADSDKPATQGRGPCLVRIFLAGNDYVVGQWCGADAKANASEFEQVLATYLPATSGVTSLVSTAPTSPYVVAEPQSCAQLVTAVTDQPTDTSNWGKELATPTDSRWGPYPLPGASVCSNFVYVNSQAEGYPGYSFQCTELVNRFLGEQWGHGPLDGNAETYFDYYDSTGVRHDGSARVYADAVLSDDGNQGTSSFKPGPGDLLVFQDVQDGAQWTSGIIPGSYGHVAIVTAVTDTQVFMMQQNFSDSLYYMSLPITKVATGWHITDTVSGVQGRIVRGWIHFSEDTAEGNAGPPPVLPAQDTFVLGADHELYNYHWVAGSGWQPALNVRLNITPTPALVTLIGRPSTNGYQLSGVARQSVFVIGNDGHLYEYWWRVTDGWHRDDVNSYAAPPAGINWTGSPCAFTYTNPADSLVHHSVFLLGSDGHLYHYDWVQNATWSTPVDISGTPPVTLSGTPTGFGWVEKGAEYQAAYSVGSDGHLYEYSTNDGTTWMVHDVTAASKTALPTGVQLTGTASGYAFTLHGEAIPRRTLFVVGSDNHLYNYNWVAGGSAVGSWDVTDVSAGVSGGPTLGAGGVTLVPTPSAAYVPGNGGLFEVYLTASDGHVYQYVYQNGWNITDVSAQAGQPTTTKLASAPFAFTSQQTNAAGKTAQVDNIYVVTGDGQLVILTYQPGATSAWSFAEEATPADTTLTGNTPSGFAY